MPWVPNRTTNLHLVLCAQECRGQTWVFSIVIIFILSFSVHLCCVWPTARTQGALVA